MKKLLLTTLLATATIASGVQASSYETRITEETRAQIQEKLKLEGYEVRKIDQEDGMIEVYALKDGQRMELYLDKDLNVVRTKTDD